MKSLLPVLCIMLALAAGPATAAVYPTSAPVCPIGGYTNVGCPVATDAVIRNVISSRLAGLGIPNRNCISVGVANGVVTLTGIVDNLTLKDLATIMASSARGVNCVDNRLALSEIGSLDLAIVAAVRKALDKQPYQTRQVFVTSYEGVVTLRGEVYSTLALFMAPQVAYDVHGVQAVQNHLIIVDPGHTY